MGVVTSILGASPRVLAVGGPSSYYYYGGLGLLAATMIWAAILAQRSWEEANEDLDPATPDELLDAFRQARAEGELDETEFARVQQRLKRGE
jgi:hypothetical protein